MLEENNHPRLPDLVPVRYGRMLASPFAFLRGSAVIMANDLEAGGIWTIQTGIFPENTASIRLHEQAGFRAVGTRRGVGRHHGRWRDVLMMERRSTVAGTG